VSHVQNMCGMFSESKFNGDISRWNTSNVENMRSMFDGCSSLQSIDLSSFNTTNVKDMSDMFADCSSLKKENVKIGSYGEKILNELK